MNQELLDCHLSNLKNCHLCFWSASILHGLKWEVTFKVCLNKHLAILLKFVYWQHLSHFFLCIWTENLQLMFLSCAWWLAYLNEERENYCHWCKILCFWDTSQDHINSSMKIIVSLKCLPLGSLHSRLCTQSMCKPGVLYLWKSILQFFKENFAVKIHQKSSKTPCHCIWSYKNVLVSCKSWFHFPWINLSSREILYES